jgi:Sulfotransferase family
MASSSSQPEGSGAELPVGRIPDFFIVGHHKSGTTAMYEMLRRHPEIFMPRMKEPEFFGRDHSGRRAEPRDSAQQSFGASRPRDLAEYTALFDGAGPGQIAGEASPSYLRSLTAAGEIAEAQPAARIIAILREPASFLRSLHLQMVRNHVQPELDLRKAILGEGRTSDGKRVVPYSDRVRYVEQLSRYHAVLPSEQMLVLIYDDFRADNEAVVRTVLRFLDVDPNAAVEPINANPSIAPRSRALDVWVHRMRTGSGPVARRVNTAFKRLTPARTRHRAVRAFQRNVVYREAPPADEAFTNELRRRFKPEVLALSEYLDRDLVKLWGYDEL